MQEKAFLFPGGRGQIHDRFQIAGDICFDEVILELSGEEWSP